MMDYDCVVLDIEGTTTSIAFVHDILFPYVLRVLDDFLKQNWSEPELQLLVDALRKQAEEDVGQHVKEANRIPSNSSAHEIQDAVAASVRWQMKQDRKAGPLKAFQGFVWRYGYAQGELKGHVYSDVVPALERWKKAGKDIYIYSSGSIEAQKLIFGFSDAGNLLLYFKGHFDTGIGMKIETSSYTKIAKKIHHSPSRILFVSDNVNEIRAAVGGGLQVAITDRPGNAPIDSKRDAAGQVTCLVAGQSVHVVKSFDELFSNSKL
ncbi:acireductone synthase [Synchytrium microbalum]|uniref:Acireductone synthase n=1 Tax=Synchytrium microbalum TaxID=1806994 RepID=A0A507BZC2_9FUNG|nr:acireductone synthase [Synchytrium microbalum]TPX32209.1 acireductone synthase [Synchytrium microbalum]